MRSWAGSRWSIDRLHRLHVKKESHGICEINEGVLGTALKFYNWLGSIQIGVTRVPQIHLIT